MRELDPGQPITQASSLEQSLRTAGASPRFTTFLFGVLGGIGLVLAVVGVFGVTSWTTAQRTREFGIRIALGALPSGVLRLALKNMSQSVLAGLLVGLGLSVTFSVLSNGRLEGMGTLDPLTFAGVPLILAAAAVLACLGPALSATRVEPMDRSPPRMSSILRQPISERRFALMLILGFPERVVSSGVRDHSTTDIPSFAPAAASERRVSARPRGCD